MSEIFTDQQLQAYLDESLSTGTMAKIEQVLRVDQQLRDRLIQVAATREAGVHGLGEIWRRNRLSCPSRQQLGSFLLGAMEEDQLQYVRFHIESVQCRWCLANLEDLKKQSSESQTTVQTRRRKYFQTSAGYLSSRKRSDP